MPRLLLALIAFVAATVAASAARAAPNLDPFRSPTSNSPSRSTLPLGSLWSQAPSSSSSSSSAPSSSPSPTPAPTRVACTDDDQCGDGQYCDKNFCRRIEQRTNVFFLYYQEGNFLEILGLYWSKRGSSGYRVVAPLYWHFWSPQSRARVVAPFYWRFDDYAIKRRLTVIVPILPVSWSSEPGARSFGIWPLFYLSTKFGWAAPLLGSFTVGDPDRGKAFGSVAFLYWWSRKPQSSFDLLFPVFVSKRSPSSAFTFALPLNFYWRSGQQSHTLAIPFFYRSSGKDSGSLYSLLGYYSRQGPASNGSVAWLYHFGRNSSAGTAHDVLFPIVWDFRRPGARTTVAGPVVHVRRGATTVDTVAALWWSGSGAQDQPGKGWKFRTLLPLFFWQESDGGKKSSWFTPIGGYSRDDHTAERTLLLLLGAFVRRDPVREIDFITPLYIRHHHRATDATKRLIGLLFYRSDDPEGSTTTLFPLFWRFHDTQSGATATAFLPFFARRSGPRDTMTAAGVFPAWFYWRRTSDGGWGAGLFPLAFFGRRGDNGHGVVFPLFWRWSDARGSFTGLFPLFFARGRRTGYDVGLLPLLTFFGREAERSYQVQFPLFWRFADAAAGTSTTVTPLGFFGSSRQDGWRFGVGPLVPIVWAGGGGPRRHFVLFPLFWHFGDDRQDSSTTVALTFMHRRRGGEVTDALFPLLYYRRGARPGGADETSFTLFPLVHYRRDADTRVFISPLAMMARGPHRSAGFIGPYLWYRGPVFSASGVPLLFADVHRSDTREHTRQIGPWVSIDGPAHSVRMLFPVFGRYQDQIETDTFVFPTYFRVRKTDGYALDTLAPLYWHSRWKDRTTTVIGPWYSRKGSDVHNTGLAPLYFWAKNPQRTVLAIPPLLTFHRHDFKADRSLTVAGGLYVDRHTPESDFTTLFPLWWSGRSETKGEDKRHRVLVPVYWHFEDRKADARWTLLVPFYWSKRDTAVTRALLPVAWYHRNSADGSGSEALLPLFYAAHGPSRFTLLTLLAGYSRSPTTRRWYAGPIYAHDTTDSSVRVVFPLYFSHFNRATETRTRVIPVLHFSRTSPEKSLSNWALLLWRRTDVASATTLGLPLYYDIHDYNQKRTTVLFPLFVRHENAMSGHTYWLAPLFYRHVGPVDRTTVALPLFWDFKRGDDTTTIFFPFYAHWIRSGYSGTYVFPNVYYRKGLTMTRQIKSEVRGEGQAQSKDARPGPMTMTPDGTWRVIVFPFYDAAVDRPGDFRWEVLGGLFGKERIGRNHFLKLFFFFNIQTKKPTAVQTAWYGQPNRPSRTAPTRGLATNAW